MLAPDAPAVSRPAQAPTSSTSHTKTRTRKPKAQRATRSSTLSQVAIIREWVPTDITPPIGKDLLSLFQPIEVGTFSYIWRGIGKNDLMNLSVFLSRIIVPGQPKIYTPPSLPLKLPEQRKKMVKVPPTSVLPLLIAVRRSGIDVSSFHFVLERSSFNKLVKRDEKWRIGIQRIGQTIFFRRHITRKTVDKTDAGSQFEAACSIAKSESIIADEFLRIVKANIGEFRVLISGETDAISKEGKYVEFKCAKSDTWGKKKKEAVWIQSFLLGVPTIVQGERSNDNILMSIKEHPVASLASISFQEGSIHWIHSMLCFLTKHVKEGLVYELHRGPPTTDRQIYLYEVSPMQRFISLDLLKQVAQAIITP